LSAWTQLYNFGRAIIKRPAVWLGGVLAVAAGTYVKTNLLTPLQTYVSEKTAEKVCQYQQTPISDESQFTILVSPLAYDPDRSQTERVMGAFLGEKGFLVVPICESLGFVYSKDLQTPNDETLQRARDLITARHADLLLFGEILERDKAVKIYAVNEHGGSDLHPMPTIIKYGVLSNDFNAEVKSMLIEVSLREILSAKLNQSSVDWPLFAKRMNKMEMFLNHFDFSQDKSLVFASSYIEATRLLYRNGQGDIWFLKGEDFAKRIIATSQESSKSLSSIYTEYAMLLDARFDNTNDKNDRDAALHAFDTAISLDPIFAFAYANRGVAYETKGDFDRAIEDYTRAISLDPNDARAYNNRGNAYLNKRELDRAIADYTQAIRLDPKLAQAFYTRGYAYSKKGDFDRAIEDYSKAISLDPKLAQAFYTRGYAYSNKGDFDRAIEDYSKAIAFGLKNAATYTSKGFAYLNKGDLDLAVEAYTDAIRLDPKNALAYVNRGLTYSYKGDSDRAIEDYTKAIELDPKLAVAYDNRGVAYKIKGEWDRAIKDLDKAIGLDPNRVVAYDNRGFAYKNKGDLDRAIEDYTKAIGLDPKYSVAYRDRGEAYKAKGDVDRAAADFQRSVELKPQ
jgi:tetratricopeptide (TPR) repeat protein